ncbi:hypothetical protein D9758_014180 [Tetrapyrgos nigripes]|uniref:Glycoside hydrolase family 71 protein n=1 Tax=Tetrapyrgos nigripes TaxID=182062 RepID=A0A8H5CKA1_9AGAR|nr:hypothetical protein D9758_014180 [Tetrapyrgos nigripes]
MIASAQKVFTHFMAQNSFSYSQSDWASDISAAKAIGIDGFGATERCSRQLRSREIVDAFAAAEAANFQLFFSFDMGYPWAQSDMISLVSSHASSPSMFRWNGAVLVSTFNGEDRGDPFWVSFKDSLASQNVAVSFAPAFIGFRDPNRSQELVNTFSSIDGFFNWWSWPADVAQDLTTDTDLAYKAAISSKSGPYIMAVSSWQFKELGGDQDWVEQSDTLWKYRWEQAIDDVKPDIVEIVTWNDYGESHYIADINPKVDLGTLAPNYVNGFEHGPWRIMAEYYISWFKNGSPPSINTDTVVFWYRAHPKAVTCSGGDRPRNSDFPADAIFAFSMLTSPATISLDVGSRHTEFNAGVGVAIGSIPFPSEDSQIPFIQIIRNGVSTKSIHGSTFITNACSYYNFNPWVGVLQ